MHLSSSLSLSVDALAVLAAVEFCLDAEIDVRDGDVAVCAFTLRMSFSGIGGKSIGVVGESGSTPNRRLPALILRRKLRREDDVDNGRIKPSSVGEGMSVVRETVSRLEIDGTFVIIVLRNPKNPFSLSDESAELGSEGIGTTSGADDNDGDVVTSLVFSSFKSIS